MQCWDELLLKVACYNIALLSQKITNSVTLLSWAFLLVF